MAPKGPMPGRIPVIVPTTAPTKAKRRLPGESATLNPCAKLCQTSMSYPLNLYRNVSMNPLGRATPRSIAKTTKQTIAVNRDTKKHTGQLLNLRMSSIANTVRKVDRTKSRDISRAG